MANNYKQDDSKPPVMDAIFIPYAKTLMALAAMMQDMKQKHMLGGAKDPFQEWRQLPDARRRLANAGARHALMPWQLNTKDALPGTKGHLHILHGIWGLMSAYEKWVEEQTAIEAQDHLRTEAAKPASCLHSGGLVNGHCADCQTAVGVLPFPQMPVMWWSDEGGTWRCVCGAGRAEACVCPHTGGNL